MSENNVLVIGGGISGITAAIEAAEAGQHVVLIEKNSYLGGRVAQLNKYFPKLCPPICGLELNFRRMKENADIQTLTQAEVTDISGSAGAYEVTVKVSPRHVNDKCVVCGDCAEVCPSERSNDFNLGMDTTKCAYMPFNQAYPYLYVIDRAGCKDGCTACAEACKYDAVELDAKPETMTFTVGSVITATGWDPYEAKKLDILGFGQVKNVVTNMMMERLASPSGPTGGKILRPSDGKEVRNVGFVQCAGSRDESHLEFCSYICCMASLKQTRYVREQYEDSKAQIFYIDMRTPGRYEKFYKDVIADENVTLTKGKVAKVEQAEGDDVRLVVEDVHGGKKLTVIVDMLVLATGMQPSGATNPVPTLSYSEDGFVDPAKLKAGMAAIGSSKSPVDVQRSVQDATAAAMISIQSQVRR